MAELRNLTPDQLSELDDSQFFDYLDRLEREPDVPAQALTDAGAELQTRLARIETAMRAEGMTREQVDQLRATTDRAMGVKKEDSV
jgi:hypothetical protein